MNQWRERKRLDNLARFACLSVWFPILEASGVPVPRTKVITGDWDGFEMIETGTVPTDLVVAVREAGDELGWPCFLRTGHGANQFEWDTHCHVPDVHSVDARVWSLVKWSTTAAWNPLPVDVWAVRELLPPDPEAFVAFGGLPIRKEVRVFIETGSVLYSVPYWNSDTVRGGAPDIGGWGRTKNPVPGWRYRLEQLNRFVAESFGAIEEQSAMVAASFRGAVDGCDAWSLDWVFTHDCGWVAVDMAPAETSWGWTPTLVHTP